MFQWVSSMNSSSDVLGFVQWKPVAYRTSHPVLEDATPCRHSDPRSQSGEETAASSGLIQAFYSDPEAMGLNVSFGLAGEPFYNSTMFLSWFVHVIMFALKEIFDLFFYDFVVFFVSIRTMLVGVGSPPLEFFSPLVLSIMVVCLGTPVVLLLLGGAFVFIYKKRKASTTAYQPIN